MSSTLDRIRAKITRAKQHIQDFQLALRAFEATSPYEVAMKEDLQSGKRIYHMSKADSVPYNLTAIAADVIQNLRSSLDHIAHQLVLDARGGTKPEWTVYYPISGSASAYPGTRSGKIKGVRQEVIDAIDATEPYQGGKGHALWQLNELNKSDKHELLVGAGVVHGIDVLSGITDFFPEEDLTGFDVSLFAFPVGSRLPVLNKGDPLYIEPIKDPVAQKRRFAFYVALDAPKIIKAEPAIETLQNLANLVDDIVTQLGRFLS